MSIPAIITLTIVLLFSLLLGGMWVFNALGIAGVLGIFLLGTDLGGAISYQVWGSSNNFILTAIPLFIFMGEIMLRSGISDRLYSGVSKWVGSFPGGLIHTNVVACALFAAISGSSVATAASIGTVAIPDQEARGYDKKLILGSIVASGTLGILIPPSIIMILYGSWMEVSIARLFAAGIIPGIMISLFFMLFVVIKCLRQPKLAPRLKPSSLKEKLFSLKEIWPGLLIITFIMVAIFGGLMTPSETAAVSVALVLLLATLLGSFSWRLLYKCAINTIYTSTMILIIYVSAKILVMSLMYLGVISLIPQFVDSLGLSPIFVLLVIYLIYLILGCFFDGTSLLLITLPIVQPLIANIGVDLVWFGVVVTILIELGMITPPVGLNLYVITGISDSSLSETIKGVFPFFLILLACLGLFTICPQLVTWFPDLLFGG